MDITSDHNAPLFPASYRVLCSTRALSTASLGCLLTVLLFLPGRFGYITTALGWVSSVVFNAFVVLASLGRTSWIITIHPDRIEKKSWFGYQAMQRADAAEIRRDVNGRMMLVHRTDRRKCIALPETIGGDAAWKEWTQGLKGAAAFNRHRKLA